MATRLVLAHGAGAGMSHPWMTRVVRAFDSHGIEAVTFNFPYMDAGKSVPDKPAVLAETYNKQFVPHQTQPTIGTAANLHCIAALPWATRPQEYTGQRPELDVLFKEPLVWQDGCLLVPDRPGLGLELDEAKLAEMAV